MQIKYLCTYSPGSCTVYQTYSECERVQQHVFVKVYGFIPNLPFQNQHASSSICNKADQMFPILKFSKKQFLAVINVNITWGPPDGAVNSM